MKSTSLASRLSGYSVDGRKCFVKDLSHFKSASVDRPLLTTSKTNSLFWSKYAHNCEKI